MSRRARVNRPSAKRPSQPQPPQNRAAHVLNIVDGGFSIALYTYAWASWAATGCEAAMKAYDFHSAQNYPWMIGCVVAAIVSGAIAIIWLSPRVYDSYTSILKNQKLILRREVIIHPELITLKIWHHEPHIRYMQGHQSPTPDPVTASYIAAGSVTVVLIWSVWLWIEWLAILSAIATVVFFLAPKFFKPDE